MIKITLKPAKNGVIKEVIDNNHGGAGVDFSSVELYESTKKDKDYIKRFFYDICEDLNLHIGGKWDKEVLSINSSWGSHYKPTKDEIADKIKNLKAEINLLKEWKTK